MPWAEDGNTWYDETPDVPALCPDCFPAIVGDLEAAHKPWVTQYCTRHAPSADGSEDVKVSMRNAVLSGSGETDSVDNRVVCDYIHRETRSRRSERQR
jgi:hypothetical protein